MSWYYDILNYLAVFLINPMIPPSDPNWEVVKKWEKVGDEWVFEAKTEQIPKLCAQNPHMKVHAPIINQGFHEFYIDGKVIATSGDRDYRYGHALYNVLDVDCSHFTEGILKWKIRTKTQSFARMTKYPELYSGANYETLLVKGITLSMAGGTIFLALFLILIFQNYFQVTLLFSIFASGTCMGMFLVLSNPDSFFIELQPIILHRLHDSVLWFGIMCCWIFMLNVTKTNKYLAKIYIPTFLIAIGVIISSRTLDQAQVGTTVAFFGCFIAIAEYLAYVTLRIIKSRQFSWNNNIEMISVVAVCATAFNDLALNLGAIDSVPFFTLGFPFVYALLSVLANMKISKIQQERDHLAENLEKEVASKTASLKERSDTLELTIVELQRTQAELVHSSKMASLGTLAAGIAHEINNALNYPMGAVPALGRMLSKDSLASEEIKKAKTIVNTMQEGLYLTADIIKNLKRYSGQHSSQMEEIRVKEVLDSTLVLCRNHLKQDVVLNINIPDNLNVRATKAGLSQVFMNIINNAADAMNTQTREKSITVDTQDMETEIIVRITDTGPGIPEDIKNRIFDPFFTTKPEGKGTGLGLFIVAKEIKGFGGHITVDSKVGIGTTFLLRFPKKSMKPSTEAA